MKKILSLLLIAVMCLSVLAACTNPNEDTPSGGDTTPDAETTPQPNADVSLVENGETKFVLVRPMNASGEIIDLITDFQTEFQKKTGIKLDIEYEKRDSVDNDNYEIVIGKSAHPETIEAMADLKNLDYFCGLIGNKIILVGGNDKATADAVDYFKKKILHPKATEDSKNIVFDLTDNYVYRKSYYIDTATINGVEIQNYKIVYSKNDCYASEIFAKRFKNLTATYTGYNLEVIDDSAPVSENEILIGVTNRGTPTFDEEAMQLVYENGKLYMHSSYSNGYITLYDQVKTAIYSGKDKNIVIDDKCEFSVKLSTVFKGGSENMLEKGGSLRIIVNNVWGGNESTAPLKLRMKQLVDVYRDYNPDVLGLQESNTTVESAIRPAILALGYKEVPYTEKNQNIHIYTPLFYNPETVDLIDSGFWRYNDESGDTSKAVSWGVFEEKASGKKFIAGTTHFMWNSPELGSVAANVARKVDATELAALMKELSNEYDAPVIVGGDFNCNISSEPMKILLNEGFVDVDVTAKKTETRGSHHAYPTINPSTGIWLSYAEAGGTNLSAIDHIMAYAHDKLTLNVFDSIEDIFALASSDHCPLLTDFTLK